MCARSRNRSPTATREGLSRGPPFLNCRSRKHDPRAARIFLSDCRSPRKAHDAYSMDLTQIHAKWYTGIMAEQYKRKPNTTCLICKTSIYRRPVEMKRNEGRVFCSQTCYGIHCRREKPCLICKQPILAGLNKKTCSRACANIHRIGIRYKIGRPKDKAVAERALKIRLLKERGTVCEKCGYSKSEILQVHHKNRDRKNNNLNNLELICPNCHFEGHYLQKSWLKNIIAEGGVA